MRPLRPTGHASPASGAMRGLRSGVLAALCVLLPLVGHVLTRCHAPRWIIVDAALPDPKVAGRVQEDRRARGAGPAPPRGCVPSGQHSPPHTAEFKVTLPYRLNEFPASGG